MEHKGESLSERLQAILNALKQEELQGFFDALNAQNLCWLTGEKCVYRCSSFGPICSPDSYCQNCHILESHPVQKIVELINVLVEAMYENEEGGMILEGLIDETVEGAVKGAIEQPEKKLREKVIITSLEGLINEKVKDAVEDAIKQREEKSKEELIKEFKEFFSEAMTEEKGLSDSAMLTEMLELMKNRVESVFDDFALNEE